jgi:uncharacterized membrane protein
MADLSTVGLVFPVAVVLGYFAGRTVGGWLGSEEGGALTGVLVGVVSGFYNLLKVGLRLQREDRAAEADEGVAKQEAGARGDEDPEPRP